MMPTAFWLTRRMRSMRRPYSQPLLTSVRLLCSSSLRQGKQNITQKKLLSINKSICCPEIPAGDFFLQNTKHTLLQCIYRCCKGLCSAAQLQLNTLVNWSQRDCTHNSSMLFIPKKAPSMSFVMPFLCIFSDFKESIPLNVRLSTILILLRFSSLQTG